MPPFRPSLKQKIYVSAVSSDMGLEPQFANENLVGGSAIITGGLWVSKVSSASQDTSGFGTFSITTMQGKYNRGISFISA
jgi:hypothetical protein